MASGTRIHPPVAPTPPYWKGVSDLLGPIGDALYGYYDRSDNVMVRDMGTVEKRRGYERAFDELFQGACGVAMGRDESSLVWLAVDSEGVKVLSSLPQTEFAGYTLDHPGFMQDEFTRGDNADIQTGTTLPWIEGQDSTENTAHTTEDILAINTNALRLTYTGAAINAHADWNLEAVTPFHTLRVEMDMSAVALTTNQGVNVFVFMGLPDFYTDAVGAVVKTRIWGADAYSTLLLTGGATDHCWSGIAGKFKLTGLSASTMEAEMELWEFSSSERQDSVADRLGRVGQNSKKTSANAISDASGEVTWVMEIGRKQGPRGGWVTRIDVYQNTTIATLEAGNISTLWNTIESEEHFIDGAGAGSYFWNMPLSGKGGYSGLRFAINGSPASGSIRVNQIKAGLSFLVDQFPE